MPGSPRFLGRRAWLPIGLVLLLLLPGSVFAQPAPAAPTGGPVGSIASPISAHPIVPARYTTLNTTLTVSNSSFNLSNQFWGTTVNNEVRMFRGETDAVNATPARVLVWPGAMAGEDYDPFAQIHYSTYYGTPSPALTNEPQFVQMCKSIHCIAILQVPAEIDDPAFAARIVNYTETNLSFTPAYWMIGNEPELWSHWKAPWKDWPTTYTAGPTPAQFANEVLAYVKAIRVIDNSTPILGLPASGCTCGYWTFEQWISGVLNVTGNKIQAVAFHEYPAGWLGTGNGSLQAFYQTIQSAAGIPPRMVGARQAVQLSCPKCNVSVFISELGSALSWSTYGPYAIGFSGALSLASQVTQAMDDNLTNLDLFATELATTNSWFDPTGHPRVDYTLYGSILTHLGTQAFQANTTGLGRSVYAIATIAPNDQGRRDLLVVNDNISHQVSFVPRFAEYAGNAAVQEWSWNGSIHYTASNATGWVEPFTTDPVSTELPQGLPGTYILPPQSMVLFETYPSGGTYVHLLENGVPAGLHWYASVANQSYTTTATNISLFLHPGAYPVGSVGIPLPVGGREYTPVEQLGGSVNSPFEVSGSHANTTISFHPQWAVNVSANPSGGGTVGASPTWWNASQPLDLTATAAVGYAFQGWSGWGPGSYNGTARSISIVPTGRIIEKARFAVGEQVVFWQTGLPAGTDWSVRVRGILTNTTTDSLTIYEPYGAYGYSVAPVPGFRSLPKNGGFDVTSTVQLVNVLFVPITPPPPAFDVVFRASGLPPSTAVSITVRGLTQGNALVAPVFQLINGTYAYHVGYIPGYHVDLSNKTFQVTGGPMTVVVPFVRTVYTATWEATGTRAGLNWTVVLNGQPTNATSAWVSSSLPNGTYSYTIELSPNYSANPRSGVVTISGAGTQLPLVFSLVVFPTQFVGSGPGASGSWSVRLGNTTHGQSASGSTFLAANGTYTWDVHAPDGYYAVPSHGNLTVAGLPPPIAIQFHPSSGKPSAALVAALTSGALSASIWIGASIFVGFATFRGLRRRDG